MSPNPLYQQRYQEFQQTAAQWQKRYNSISWVRVLVFVTGIAGTWLLYTFGLPTIIIFLFALITLVLFLYLMKYHNQVAYQRNQHQFLSQINLEEINRLQGKHFPEETGAAYLEATHPYTIDLDIFGRSSLFSLLNRTTTTGGNELLAQWLKKAAPMQVILQRQQAVKELANPLHLEWRQQFQASGMHAKAGKKDLTMLMEWMKESPRISPRKLLVALVYVMPVITIAAILAAIFTEVTYHLPALLILINASVLGSTFKEVKQASEQTAKSAQVLRVYAKLLEALEKGHFSSERMQALKNQLKRTHHPASAKIQQLSGLLTNLEARQNAYFYMVVSTTTLWDLYFLIRLEKWKQEVSAHINHWLEAISETEVLCSLAGFYHTNPEYIMPAISTINLKLSAQNVGHPLILKEKRVTNSISMEGRGKTAVITGSNMSGKSTFLRTVGVNAVLALAGAPVCATGFEIAVFQVFSAMRTQDSLEESVSSFYAELKRLKQLIDRLPLGEPILYLLDEILKGTNSQDRHLGAQALIRQLHKHNASGFISTHDLALGDMATEMPGFVENYSFNSEVINEKLVFDYKLQKGVCRSFNASKLMQQIGIEME